MTVKEFFKEKLEEGTCTESTLIEFMRLPEEKVFGIKSIGDLMVSKADYVDVEFDSITDQGDDSYLVAIDSEVLD